MTRHDDLTRLRHMLAHAEEAVEMARGCTRRDLDADRRLNLSLVRLLEVVGEAGSHISPEGQARDPGIPWPEVIGLRNRLVHGYDKVDFDILWDIVRYDLPLLVTGLCTALEREVPATEA